MAKYNFRYIRSDGKRHQESKGITGKYDSYSESVRDMGKSLLAWVNRNQPTAMDPIAYREEENDR